MAHEVSYYVGNELEFPILRGWDFFNHAGVSPLPRVGGEALRAFARQYEEGAYLESGFYKRIEELRRSAAGMIGAEREEVAFVKNTSEGLATVAAGIDWRAGDRIVTTAVEYPANMYPWMDLARRVGVELVTVAEVTAEDGSRSVPLEALLKAAEDPRTRMVTLSHVEYASGQRHDLAKVGAFCRERGILFCVDAIQSMGVLPVDVKGNIYGSGPGGIWIISPEGEHIATIHVPERASNCGWGGADNQTLYITASSSVYRIRLGVPGFKVARRR